jgi:hypothetical protein
VDVVLFVFVITSSTVAFGAGSFGAVGSVVEGSVGASGSVVVGETPIGTGPVGPAGSVSAAASVPQTQMAVTNAVTAAQERMRLHCEITLQPPCCTCAAKRP